MMRSLTAAMRLRLRDGDHLCRSGYACPGAESLQCGSVSGTEITRRAVERGDCREIVLQCGSVSGTEITGSTFSTRRAISLQCGSVSGTEITSVGIDGSIGGTTSCNAAPSQGRRSRKLHVPFDAKQIAAAMRLRLRDGDYSSPERRATILAERALQCGSVSGTEITGVSDPGRLRPPGGAAMRLRLRDGDHPLSGDWRPLDGNLAAMRLRLRDGDHPDPDRIFLTDFEAAMRLRLRDGDHGMDRQIMPAQIGAAMRLRLRDGDHGGGVGADHPHRGDHPAAMRLRLRDGDHPRLQPLRMPRRTRAAMRLRLRDGDHGRLGRAGK